MRSPTRELCSEDAVIWDAYNRAESPVKSGICKKRYSLGDLESWDSSASMAASAKPADLVPRTRVKITEIECEILLG